MRHNVSLQQPSDLYVDVKFVNVNIYVRIFVIVNVNTYVSIFVIENIYVSIFVIVNVYMCMKSVFVL